MTFGSLFAGIGGLDLGLERAGMTCEWQVEIDAYATRVLARHWPHVRRWDDVRTFLADAPGLRRGAGRERGTPPHGEGGTDAEGAARWRLDDWRVDLICGGFPCQDISFAGKGAGLAGERSGLWHEFARAIRVLEPRYVLVENVPALLVRGLDAVLGTLASLGYDAEWHCLSAAAVGAPHLRDRTWILAHSHREGQLQQGRAYGEERRWPGDQSPPMVHAAGGGRFEQRQWLSASPEDPGPEWAGWWAAEPDVGRMAHGIPHRVDRLRGLGNAVVPQVAEWIGRRLMEIA